MKRKIAILIFSVLLFSIEGLNSQSFNNNVPVLPLKSTNSILFGKDIIIHDQPDQDQRNVAICSAFNGWLYTAYSYYDVINSALAFTIMKSIDNGITWSFFYGGDLPFPADNKFKSIDIAVIGDSISNLKVIFAGLFSNSPNIDLGEAIVWTFNGETGAFEQGLFDQISIYGIALATDCNWTAYNSNPYSLGVLYSKWSTNRDSIIFRSSGNGGVSLDGWHVVATTTNRYHKVALAYGRSPSWSSGRYFAAWQEQDSIVSKLGHIYTSHTNPDFNSPFTTPVNLDSLNPSNIKKCRNPAIACQYNNADNDSANLTEVVLFDKYNQSSQKYDIAGYYNLQAANHSKFRKLTISDSLHNNIQPDINFNPYDSTFMVTYFDSTSKKLPFVINNYNLLNANQWQVVSSGYNDSSNLAAPFPKVELNFGQQQGANVWIAEGTGGNGIAMFDAPYSTYTGISGNTNRNNDRLSGAYPNPCKDFTTFDFELKKPGNVKIELYDIYGQAAGILKDQYYTAGRHKLKCDISKYSSGTYIYKFHTSSCSVTGKLIIIR